MDAVERTRLRLIVFRMLSPKEFIVFPSPFAMIKGKVLLSPQLHGRTPTVLRFQPLDGHRGDL